MVLLELDPNVVKPGWTPLIIIIVLLGAMIFLYRSMRKQMRRIDAPYAEDLRAQRRAEATAKLRPDDPGDGSTDDPPGSAPDPQSAAGASSAESPER